MNITIMFIDGKRYRIEDVDEYGLSDDNLTYYYIKNGKRAFMTKETVMYIGEERFG